MMPAILSDNGQMCIQPARLVIPEHRKDEIVAAFTEVVVGPPDAPGTDLGPLITCMCRPDAAGPLPTQTLAIGPAEQNNSKTFTHLRVTGPRGRPLQGQMS
jgi:hypothetical protein